VMNMNCFVIDFISARMNDEKVSCMLAGYLYYRHNLIPSGNYLLLLVIKSM
jgi:hypothetical protein